MISLADPHPLARHAIPRLPGSVPEPLEHPSSLIQYNMQYLTLQ
jgi:hypothetical protein